MANYTIQLNAFAPWERFGAPLGIGKGYEGDHRGFLMDGTSRLHLTGVYNSETRTFQIDPILTGCDPSYGRIEFIGPDGTRTGQLTQYTPTVLNSGNSTTITNHIQAANPLITAAPVIDYKAVFTFTQNPSTHQLEIATSLSGAAFPAVEAKVIDESGSVVFLGGFSPESKGEILNLAAAAIKDAFSSIRDLDAFYTGRVTLNLDEQGNFRNIHDGSSISHNFSSQTLHIKNEMSIADWNNTLLHTIPIAKDAELQNYIPAGSSHQIEHGHSLLNSELVLQPSIVHAIHELHHTFIIQDLGVHHLGQIVDIHPHNSMNHSWDNITNIGYLHINEDLAISLGQGFALTPPFTNMHDQLNVFHPGDNSSVYQPTGGEL